MKTLKQLIEIENISNKEDELERKYENWRYSLKQYGLLEDEITPTVAVENKKGFLNVYIFKKQEQADKYAYENNGLVMNIESSHI